MQNSYSPDVKRMISEQLATGRFDDENDVLLAALDSLKNRQFNDEIEGSDDDWPLIKEALDAYDAGTNEEMTLDEAADRIRREFGL